MYKTVLIAGASGFIGTALAAHFVSSGFQVVCLSRSSRDDENSMITWLKWSPRDRFIDMGERSFDAIINLSGYPISGYWTKARMEKILNSRKESGEFLVDLINAKKIQTPLYISSSGVGIYADSLEPTNEDGTLDNDFLAQVCKVWEAPLQKLNADVRQVILRTGIVIGKDGGAYPVLEKITKWGLTSPLGSGKQYYPLIHLQDMLRIFSFCINNAKLEGVINATAPHPVPNKLLMKALAKQHNRISLPPAPSFLLKLIRGKAASVLLKSSNVLPSKLIEAGFTFEFPDWEMIILDQE